MSLHRSATMVAVVLAFIVVVVGAYVRLSDAGLGCPDWPFCYGKPVPAEIADHHALAKAWKEMGHRYLAGTLVSLTIALAIAAWIVRRGRALAASLVLVILAQAALGAWTVTLLLKPAIVTAHLIGGMTTLSLLAWLALAQWPHKPAPQVRSLRLTAAVALAAVAIQIVLGGWVSANYAALACPDLPRCPGAMDFANAFHIVRELGQTADGQLLSFGALRAIHWTHRLFANVALLTVLYAAARAWRVERRLAGLLAALALLQFSLGVANVAFSLPLPLAAAHNAGAALLLVTLVVLNFFAFRGLRPSS
ncbi:MAG TPA: COX15/CtaA family protein [Burkholderiales bacterium]|nr:COX15/CtaA family protein [Burkholderiales bacterium]